MKEEFFAKCRELGGNCTTNVPMLEMNGESYTQSSALIRHVGRVTGRYKGTYEEDVLIAAVEDLRSANYKAMRVFGATDEAVHSYIHDILPKHLENFTRLLSVKPGGFYLLGMEPCIADFGLYDALHVAERQVPGILGKYARVKLFFDTVEARPAIRGWVDSEQRKKLWAFPSVVTEGKGGGGGHGSIGWKATTLVTLATLTALVAARSFSKRK